MIFLSANGLEAMFDKYLYALGKGVRSARDALKQQRQSAGPDPANARDITPGSSPQGEEFSPGANPAPRLGQGTVQSLPRDPLVIGRNPLIMGIVNVTPDSFSDGGQFFESARAIDHGLQLAADGADILDIGGESTRPDARPVSVEEELARVIPVIAGICSQLSLPVSIDTMKAKTAAAAIEAGASIINDVWGFQFDPDIVRVAVETDVHCILMHNREVVDPALDIFEDVRAFLERSVEIAVAAGVKKDNLILDPGIGFGKTNDQSLEMVRRLGELKQAFDLPVLLGLSRKRMIGEATRRASGSPRDPGTVAANMVGIRNGADIIRVHSVSMHVDALHVLEAITGPTKTAPRGAVQGKA